MIKTSAEAERVYCPLAMHKAAQDVFCLGSNCMAFRIVDGERGYCGMAGRPPEAEKIIMGSIADELAERLGVFKKKRKIKVPMEFEI